MNVGSCPIIYMLLLSGLQVSVDWAPVTRAGTWTKGTQMNSGCCSHCNPEHRSQKPNLAKSATEGIIRGLVASTVQYCNDRWHLIQHIAELVSQIFS